MNYAIILAGGAGKRMNSDVKKQYINVKGKPLLYYTLAAFEKSAVDRLVVVTGREDEEYVRKEIIDKYGFRKVEKIIEGGKERYDSVYNGILSIEEADIVAIHDGARPFVSVEVINNTITMAEEGKAAIAAVPVKDTIKRCDMDKCVETTLDRLGLWQIQTPQTFNFQKIKAAYNFIFENNETQGVTDDSMIWEKVYPDTAVHIVESDYFNIKVTTQEDLLFADAIVGNQALVLKKAKPSYHSQPFTNIQKTILLAQSVALTGLVFSSYW